MRTQWYTKARRVARRDPMSRLHVAAPPNKTAAATHRAATIRTTDIFRRDHVSPQARTGVIGN